MVARESKGVEFLGIWGTGGVGKTTLARALYKRERERKNFEIHCFLDNIREAWEKEGLISLPRKLLSSLDRKSMEVADFYEGMELIKSKLTDRKILLVLDDVSDIRQLENLVPKKGWFSEGSIIIITTRDKHLLSSHSVSVVYEFKLLSDKESLDLFLEKAFKEEHPNEDYLKLARSVIKYAGGLPLVLTVLGSSLCKRPIVEWKDELAKLKQIPPKDILKILQVSFDGLDDQQKTIFLDIACFFNGMDKDHVIQILETLDKDLRAGTAINVLIKKSLIISYEGHLWVHEILRDMCKYIVYQESPYDAGKRSRILSLEDANHGTEAIRGIALTLEKSCDAFWDPESFSKMSNLSLLDASLPDDISMLSSLEFLDLSGNNFIDLPSGLISNLSKLEGIGLLDCPRLRSLPQLPSNLLVIAVEGSSLMKHYGCGDQLWDFIESFQPQVRNHLNMNLAIIRGDSELLVPLRPHSRILAIPGSKVPSWFYNQNYFCEKEFSLFIYGWESSAFYVAYSLFLFGYKRIPNGILL
ncbi:TMV resistance protein N-like [Neltuma alba]|uniref:TMV resistance protein N-like n=1 Tax=Neltuma alba TaxID=207710 RepID=UPI0010A57C1A|nr:TMV resistance protein N-like [Prosopis alba]